MSDPTPQQDSQPFRPVDAKARAMAHGLLGKATHAALATLTPEGAPFVTRIALACDPNGVPLTLVSRLAAHTQALLSGGPVSLLIAEPRPKGDPLTHPRLTLQAMPQPLPRDAPGFTALADHYVTLRPKAQLYIGFADFLLVRFTPVSGLLNGGFGKAYRLGPSDLIAPEDAT